MGSRTGPRCRIIGSADSSSCCRCSLEKKLITEGMTPAWSCPPAASLAERTLGLGNGGGHRSAAWKSWGRQGKGHLCHAGGVSPPRGAAVGGRDAAGETEGGTLCHGPCRRCCEVVDPKRPGGARKLLSGVWDGGELLLPLIFGPCLLIYLRSIPLQIPVPRRLALQNACAAYEMEEIKLQYLKIGWARCNI